MSIITSSSSSARQSGSPIAAVLLIVGGTLLGSGWTELRSAENGTALAQARRQMIERDLKGRGIRDSRVLTAMSEIPRHLFVPEGLRARAYADQALSIGENQTISQPYVVALMSELLELKGADRVLEIGTGSGYQTAVLARLAAQVFSIEIIPTLGNRAKEVLERLGFLNVEIKIGDGFFGWEEKAPFDAILMTAAAPRVPPALWNQLREGGRLVMPHGEQGQSQMLMRYRKRFGKMAAEEITGVVFVPLTGEIRRRER
jgi:protein-L-isoaspartate(D-aspartate) O-methyltransferase